MVSWDAARNNHRDFAGSVARTLVHKRTSTRVPLILKGPQPEAALGRHWPPGDFHIQSFVGADAEFPFWPRSHPASGSMRRDTPTIEVAAWGPAELRPLLILAVRFGAGRVLRDRLMRLGPGRTSSGGSGW